MNARESMEALLQGKKIRPKDCGDDNYIYLNKSGDLVNSIGRKTDFSAYDDFVECEEWTDFTTAMHYLTNKGKAKRQNWYGTIYFDKNDNLVYQNEYNDNEEIDYTLTKHDVLANDWILL